MSEQPILSDITQSTAWGFGRMVDAIGYSDEQHAPYGPEADYPEFSQLPRAAAPNPVFALVRESLQTLGLDADRFGTPEWNPLGDLVQPGGRIVVKPNWVLHANQGDGGMDCVITHPSVLRAVLEYVFLAAPAQVILGDAPLQGCDFEKLLDYGGLRAVIAEFQGRGLPLEVKDFRRTVMRTDTGLKEVDEELRPESDYRLVDLGADSLLEPISKDWRKFRVTVYDPRKMWKHHRPGRHRYLVAREILEADLVVNVPKLKVHKKAGITCCLKNLIGINGNKEFLPHHRKGAADVGTGDNYPRAHWRLSWAEHLLDFANRYLRGWPWVYRLFERVAWRSLVQRQKVDPAAQLEGSWHGNDTIWRTCLDLNRALLYANRKGEMTDTVQRKEISIVDAVIAGQGEGPLAPDSLKTGAVLAAYNPAIGDFVAATLLGVDRETIPLLRHACDDMRWRICHSTPAIPTFAPLFPPARLPKGWVEDTKSSET